MEPELDPYRVLGVSADSSLLDIARARRRLAKLHHPDLAAGSAAAAEMARINAAWTLLSDPDARAAWDRAGGIGDVPPGGGAAQSWTEWAYAPSSVQRRPPATSGGHAAWWVLAAMIVFLIVVVVGGVVSTLDRPDDLRQTPWLQENLDN
jgi:curved DNA-binding protein CbpA